jgi:hypothetical protein
VAPPDSLEIFINEQRADIAFFRIMLSGFLVRLFGSTPHVAEERLQALKDATLATIGRIQPDPSDPSDQGTERMKQMIGMRAEKFFAELEEAYSGARNIMGQSGRN